MVNSRNLLRFLTYVILSISVFKFTTTAYYTSSVRSTFHRRQHYKSFRYRYLLQNYLLQLSNSANDDCEINDPNNQQLIPTRSRPFSKRSRSNLQSQGTKDSMSIRHRSIQSNVTTIANQVLNTLNNTSTTTATFTRNTTASKVIKNHSIGSLPNQVQRQRPQNRQKYSTIENVTISQSYESNTLIPEFPVISNLSNTTTMDDIEKTNEADVKMTDVTSNDHVVDVVTEFVKELTGSPSISIPSLSPLLLNECIQYFETFLSQYVVSDEQDKSAINSNQISQVHDHIHQQQQLVDYIIQVAYFFCEVATPENLLFVDPGPRPLKRQARFLQTKTNYNIRQRMQELSKSFLNINNRTNDQLQPSVDDVFSQIPNVISFAMVVAVLAIIVDDNENVNTFKESDDLKMSTPKKSIYTRIVRSAASATTGELDLAVEQLMTNQNDSGKPDVQDDSNKLSLVSFQLIQSLLTVALHGCSFNLLSQDCKESVTENQLSMNNKYKSVDLHIVAALAKSLQVNGTNAPDDLLIVASQVIKDRLNIPHEEPNDGSPILCSDTVTSTTSIQVDFNSNSNKLLTSATLTLAVQLYPWQHVSSVAVVEIACQYLLWDGAERIASSTVHHSNAFTNETVIALIDIALDSRQYGSADKYATNYFEAGGYERFIEARFLHACSTISKVIKKNAIPIIERQVQRIDESVTKVMKHYEIIGTDKYDDTGNEKTDVTTERDYRTDIRVYAIRQMEEQMSDVIESRRLASIWGMEYTYDAAAAKLAAEERRRKYMQWSDVFQYDTDDDIPNVVSTPSELYDAFTNKLEFASSSTNVPSSDDMSVMNISTPTTLPTPTPTPTVTPKVYGFDAEWGGDDNSDYVALLQISTISHAILIDIPALTKTIEGCDALEQTVGCMFASTTVSVIGFSCRQDITRLKSIHNMPINSTHHWLHKGTNAIQDLQVMIGKNQPKLLNNGLSRCCQYYLGKPLDKSEQCSIWDRRPLSREQRIYAALDAYVCVAIYNKLLLV